MSTISYGANISNTITEDCLSGDVSNNESNGDKLHGM